MIGSRASASMRRPRRPLAVVVPIVLAAATGLSLAAPGVALASTLTVTTCAGSGSGSLPATVAAAAPGDTITFASGLSCLPASPITLTSTIAIAANLTITGPGAATMAVSGAGSVQVLDITAGTVTISGLTIENGSNANGTGGGISNAGTLTLTGSTVAANRAAGTCSYGGGIDNTATLTLIRSIVFGNSATDNVCNAGESLSSGGGVANAGTLTLTDSTISGNTAAFGGGIVSGVGDTVTVTDSTISGNNSDGGYGGGIYSGNSGTVTVTDSTIAANTAFLYGGGIWSGIAGHVTITSSTVADNTATGGGQGGGIFSEGFMTVSGSIVAGNTGGNAPNCVTSGGNTSAGYNLTNDGTGEECGFLQKTDRVRANPLLSPLAGNGGPTQTMLPARRSPAVGAIPPGTTLERLSACPRTDQRGVKSPPGAYCTIGAVEVTAPSAYRITIAPHSGYQVKPYTLVIYRDTTLYKGLELNHATISGEISGGKPGEVAKLYTEPFGAKHFSALRLRRGLNGTSPQRYSFTVAPGLATKYQVRVMAAATTVAVSSVVTVYVTPGVSVQPGHTHCSAGRCTSSYSEFTIIPAAAYRTEAAKHWFFYFEVGLRNPTYLFLDKTASTSKARKIKATEFSVTFTFTYLGRATSYWWAEGCVQDSLSRDGLGLPGHHGCGGKRIRFSASYVG